MKFKAQTKMVDGEKWIKFDSKFEERRYFHGNLIMLVLGLLVIVFMIILGFVLATHLTELKENPLVYGLSKLDVETFCSCRTEQGFKDFWVNSTNWGYVGEVSEG